MIKNLSSLSKDELKKYLSELERKYNYYNSLQLATKTMSNGIYGSFAHPAFSLSNKNIANAITSMGRELIFFMMKKIEDYFYNQWHIDKKIHELIGFYYLSKNDDGYHLHKKNYNLVNKASSNSLEKLLHSRSLTINDFNDCETKTITINNKNYEIFKECKLFELYNVDKIDDTYIEKPILNTDSYDDKIGLRKVPLIIYSDTDSIYLNFLPIINSLKYKGDYQKIIFNLNDVFIAEMFNSFLIEFANKYNVDNLHYFKLETINKSIIFIAKKQYIKNTLYDNGVFYDDLSDISVVGFDIIKSSTPKFVREHIYEFIEYIFKNSDNIQIIDIIEKIKNIKELFKISDIEDISLTTNLSNYDKMVIDDQNNLITKKGAHFSVKAAAFHNYLLNKYSEYKIKYDLLKGGKIKYFYCKHPIHDVFAYNRSFLPIEIISKENIEIDYDRMFEKTFLSNINRILEAIKAQKINNRVKVLNTLFKFA